MFTNPPSRLFQALFTTVVVLEIVGDETGNRLLHYGCKPMIMLLLMAWSWRQRTADSSLWLFRVGMGFSLLGDILLMIREVDLFAPGLAAFLVMQLGYIITFWRSVRTQGRPIGLGTVGLLSLPFILYAGTFLAVLRPAFASNPSLLLLWWPVVAYACCLSLMGLMAALRRGIIGYGYVLTGALLFIASDSAIAIRAFLAPFPADTPFVMITYAAAQYLIVVYAHARTDVRIY